MPTVSDLSHTIDGADVRLEWTIPSDIEAGESIVSRARTELSDDMCEGCPLVFQQIAVLPIQIQGGVLKQTHRESLSPGFRYTYRVVVKTDRGRASAASNLVTFDY